MSMFWITTTETNFSAWITMIQHLQFNTSGEKVKKVIFVSL